MVDHLLGQSEAQTTGVMHILPCHAGRAEQTSLGASLEDTGNDTTMSLHAYLPISTSN